jgi:hypothetical protein
MGKSGYNSGNPPDMARPQTEIPVLPNAWHVKAIHATCLFQFHKHDAETFRSGRMERRFSVLRSSPEAAPEFGQGCLKPTAKAEERAYTRSSALIPWTEYSGIEFQEIDKVSQIALGSHCFHLASILRRKDHFTHGTSCQKRLSFGLSSYSACLFTNIGL